MNSDTLQAPSNTDLYGVKSRIQNNRQNLKQNTDKLSDALTQVQNVNDTNINSQLLDLSTRISTLETTPDSVSQTDIVNSLSDYSVNNIEPILNDIMSDFEALSVEVKQLKQQLLQLQNQPVRQALDIDDNASISTKDIIKPSVKPITLQKKSRF